MNHQILLTIEKPCPTCGTTGKVEHHTCQSDAECPGKQNNSTCGETASVPCIDCQGVGFKESKVSLFTLARLLEEFRK